MTTTDLDFDIIEDLDFEVPCEHREPVCNKSAEWSIRRKCCGLVNLYCTGHKNMLIAFIGGKEVRAMCTRCGTKDITLAHLIVTKL